MDLSHIAWGDHRSHSLLVTCLMCRICFLWSDVKNLLGSGPAYLALFIIKRGKLLFLGVLYFWYHCLQYAFSLPFLSLGLEGRLSAFWVCYFHLPIIWISVVMTNCGVKYALIKSVNLWLIQLRLQSLCTYDLDLIVPLAVKAVAVCLLSLSI